MTMTLPPQASSTDTSDQDAAFALRQQGFTYRQIAERLGFPNTNAADYAVQRAARRQGTETPGYSPQRAQAAQRAAATRHGGAGAGRRFGVEIEVVGISLVQATAALRSAGINVADLNNGNNTYHHGIVAGQWKVVYDGSVSGGAEIVSPPLRGAEGQAEIKTVMAALTAAGARIDRQCGLHVHHDVSDLTGDEMAKVVEMYAAHQGALDGLVAPSRRNATYSTHFRPVEVADFASRLRAITGRTLTEKRQSARRNGIGGRPNSRYRVVNVHSFGLYGTIEFRQHQGTLNATKTLAWIALGQAMIEAARQGTQITTATFLADLPLAPATRTYLAERAEAFA